MHYVLGVDNKGGGMRLGMGVAMPTGVWGTGVDPPAGSRGGEVPQKQKNFKSSYMQILRIFGSTGNSHTIHEIETLIIENENYEAQL